MLLYNHWSQKVNLECKNEGQTKCLINPCKDNVLLFKDDFEEIDETLQVILV